MDPKTWQGICKPVNRGWFLVLSLFPHTVFGSWYTYSPKRGKGRSVRPMFGKRCPLPGCEWRPGQPPASSSCSGLRLPPATVTCRPTTIPLSELTWAPARAALDKDKERFCKAVEFSRQTQNSVNQLEFGHNKHHLLLRSSSNRRKILLYRPRVAWRRGILSEEGLFYRDWSDRGSQSGNSR